jgi:protein tyrosine/serine phosphatase
MQATYAAALAAVLAVAPKLPGSFEPLKEDLPNLEQVHPWLYRGAQPSEQGFALLAGMGVKTIVDLRDEEELAKKEQALVEKLGMTFVRIPIRGSKAPNDEQVRKFRGLFDDWRAYPIFVHCQRGADRTGALIAVYRIDFDGWKLVPTVKEMMAHGALEPADLAFVLAYYQKRNPPSGKAGPAPSSSAAPSS